MITGEIYLESYLRRNYNYLLESFYDEDGLCINDNISFDMVQEVTYKKRVVGFSGWNFRIINGYPFLELMITYILPDYRGKNLLSKVINNAAHKYPYHQILLNQPNHHVINSFLKNGLAEHISENLVYSKIPLSFGVLTEEDTGKHIISNFYDTYLSGIISVANNPIYISPLMKIDDRDFEGDINRNNCDLDDYIKDRRREFAEWKFQKTVDGI